MNIKIVDIDLYELPVDRSSFSFISSDVFVLRASQSRVIAGMTGPVLLGIGSGISISAGFGSFGFSVLLDGLHHIVDAPLWFSQIVMTLLFFCIAWRYARIPLGMGTLPALLLVGPAISLSATITPDTLPLAAHVAAFLVGLFMFAMGISLSAAAALGPDGVTALSLAAEKRWQWPVPQANFIWNLSAITVGLSLGGNVGPATIVGLFATPVLIRILLPRLRSCMVF